MTESDWLTCITPTTMLDFLGGSASLRKLRLFTCAWAYELWREMPDDRSRDAVLVAERFADGEAGVEELRTFHRAAADAMREVPQRFLGRPQSNRLKSRYGTRVSQRAAGVALHATNLYFDMRAAGQAVKHQSVAARYTLSNYLRDLFGNPFKGIVFDPAWLTSTVVALGKHAYKSEDYSVLPVLADALEEAGCDNEEALAHCRGQEPHIRGCWVVDLVLGKE